MERDGVALVQFLRWLKPAVQAGTETEISIGDKLRHLRSRQPLYQGLSFDTIAAYTHHGAIVHYEATPGSDIPLKPQGFLLLDSGAHYLDGTTDITRTIALGEPTQEEKFIYTLVLKGHIALSRCRFPSGSSGTQLDLAARYAMWQEGYNYGHGTGHGVGSFLCVHEGPHQIRMNYKPAPLSEGVIVTDEPGLYIEGKFGVRIENMLLCVPYKDSAFGTFVQFEPLTLCPIDTTPIDFSILTETERNWLNEYHAHVRDRLLPLLDDPDDSQWLIAATQPI
jgi:Xaa-Pro aminopeptidase